MAEPSPAAAPLYRLRIRQPETEEQEVFPEVTPFVVGREDDCDLVLTDVQVSRHHFQLEIQPDGRVVIRDLGSANGTFIDTGRVTDGAWLPLPGMISVGRSSIVVETVKRGAAPTVIAPRPDLAGPASGAEEAADAARMPAALAAAAMPDVPAAPEPATDPGPEEPVDPSPAPLAPEVVAAAAAADPLPAGSGGVAEPEAAPAWGRPADPPAWARQDDEASLPAAPLAAAAAAQPAAAAPIVAAPVASAATPAVAPIPPPVMPTPAAPIAPPAESPMSNPSTAPIPAGDAVVARAVRDASRYLLVGGLLLLVFGAIAVLAGVAVLNREDSELAPALIIGGGINLVLGIAEAAVSRRIRRPGRGAWLAAMVVSGIVVGVSGYATAVGLGAGTGANLGFFLNLILVGLGASTIVNLMRTKTWHERGFAS